MSSWHDIFSKLDLRKGYHQVPVAASDVQKSAVITPFRLFELRRTPFGLRNIVPEVHGTGA